MKLRSKIPLNWRINIVQEKQVLPISPKVKAKKIKIKA
jgi:hypothetical protein